MVRFAMSTRMTRRAGSRNTTLFKALARSCPDRVLAGWSRRFRIAISGTNPRTKRKGALTIGTRDGATIEMAQEAGEENFFLFGLTAQQVAESRGWYSPLWHYQHDPETRAALDLIFSGHFRRDEPEAFRPLRDTLLTRGDFFMHLADLQPYSQAHAAVGRLYADPESWSRKAILNVAGSGKFSSDRTIAEYASGIWGVRPCPVTEE